MRGTSLKRQAGPLLAVLVFSACAAARFDDARVRIEPAVGLALDSVQSRRNNGDTLQVQIAGHNRRGRSVQAQYRVDWVDPEGFQLSSVLSRWTILRVAADQPFVIDAIAPNPSAASFTVQIRKNQAKGYE